VLYRFAGGADGRNPFGALVSDGQGALYGTTLYGGSGTCRNPMLSSLVFCFHRTIPKRS